MSKCSGTIWRDTVARETGSEGRRHMYAYGLFRIYSKNHHNIVKKKKKKKLTDAELGLNTESKLSHT